MRHIGWWVYQKGVGGAVRANENEPSKVCFVQGGSSRSDLVELKVIRGGRLYSAKRLTGMRIFTSPDCDMAARLLSGCNTPVNVGIWGVSRDHVVPSFNSVVHYVKIRLPVSNRFLQRMTYVDVILLTCNTAEAPDKAFPLIILF